MSNTSKRKKGPKSLAEQNNALQSTVRMDGKGEDPAVKALLSEEFITMKDTEALDIATQLQMIIRGQQLSQRQFAEMSKRMEKYEENARKFEEDKQAFLDEVRMNAEKLKEVGDNQHKIMAQGIKKYQDEVKNAKVMAATERLEFSKFLADQPKEMVVSPGNLVMVSGPNGTATPQLMAEEVRIKDKVWVLQPGQLTEVPKIVADIIRQRRFSAEETKQREAALATNSDAVELSKRWNQIGEQFGSKSEAIPV